jgi:hypothetical protein
MVWKKNMLKHSLSFFLSTLLCFTSFGCYVQDQLERPETVQEETKRQAEIRTKQGQVCRLVDYRITETSITGKDEKGNAHEYLLENLVSINFVPDNRPVETYTNTHTDPQVIILKSGGELTSDMPTGLDTNGKSESDLKRIVESLPGIMLDARRDKKSEFQNLI